jgi:hypothetical protein
LLTAHTAAGHPQNHRNQENLFQAHLNKQPFEPIPLYGNRFLADDSVSPPTLAATRFSIHQKFHFSSGDHPVTPPNASFFASRLVLAGIAVLF